MTAVSLTGGRATDSTAPFNSELFLASAASAACTVAASLSSRWRCDTIIRSVSTGAGEPFATLRPEDIFGFTARAQRPGRL